MDNKNVSIYKFLTRPEVTCLGNQNLQDINRMEYDLFSHLALLETLKEFQNSIVAKFSLSEINSKIDLLIGYKNGEISEAATSLKNDYFNPPVESNHKFRPGNSQVYALIIKFICSEEVPLNFRIPALKNLALHSRQKFDRDLSLGKEGLRIEEVLEWQRQGYPQGQGYEKPKQDPALINPVTPLELACAALQRRITRETYYYDPASPTGFLVIGDRDLIEELTKKWSLPAVYLEFLQRFCPLSVSLDSTGNSLDLRGLKKEGRYWGELPQGYFEIADIADEWIYALNLSKPDDKAPVYRSRPEKIAFKKYKKTFVEFLQSLGDAP